MAVSKIKKFSAGWEKLDVNLLEQVLITEYGDGTLEVWYNDTIKLAWFSLRWTISNKKMNANVSISIGTYEHPFVAAQRTVGYATNGSTKYQFYMPMSKNGVLLVHTIGEIPQGSTLYVDAIGIIDV